MDTREASGVEEEKVWLITGCSTGMGRAFARAALEAGYRVAVTARKTETLSEFPDRFPDRALALALDVTRKAQVDAAVGDVLARFGRLDVLVNNAGYGYLSAIEEGDETEVRAMFETNFFGVLSMIRAVLPHMRARRSGQIINNSSQAGLMSKPGTGYYSTTKYAVEALTEALFWELAPLGIQVTAIQPGPFRTDWAGRSMQRSRTLIDDYGEIVHARTDLIRAMDGDQPGDPERAADAVVSLVRCERPPPQLLLGRIVLENYREKLAAIRSMLDEWEHITLGADYPTGSAERERGSETR